MQLLCRKCGKAAALLAPSGPRQLLLDRQRHRPSNVMEGRCLFYRSRFRLASLFLLVLAIVVALENHGVCFLPFFFCVQFDLDAVSFWGVWFVIRALVPGWHRSAPTKPAGETSDGIVDATRPSNNPAYPARESVCRPLAQAGGKDNPGASAPASGAICFAVCAPSAAFLFRLRRSRPWSAAPHLANF